MRIDTTLLSVFNRLAQPLGRAAILAMIAAASQISGPARADEPMDDQPPVEAAAPPPAVKPEPHGQINIFAVQAEWPRKSYPVPVRKPRYGPPPGSALPYFPPRDEPRPPFAYPERPDFADGPPRGKPEDYPEPVFTPESGYAGAYPKEPRDRDRYGPPSRYSEPKYSPKYPKGEAYPTRPPYAEGPDEPKRAYGVSIGGPRKPDPELPLAPDFELNRHRGFGRLFIVRDPYVRNGPGLHAQGSPLADLRALGEVLKEAGDPDDPAGDSDMPAGYTFLGQFIDHDMTLDVSTDMSKGINGDEVRNTRTPDLDLDNVYGEGPVATPYLYKLPYLRTGRLLAGEAPYARHDLPRTEGKQAPGPYGGSATAIIGDPRDDENFIVAQLHAAFIAFHNRTADVLVQRKYGRQRYKYCKSNVCSIYILADSLPAPAKAEIFQKARDHVLHYYHRVIAEDFLPWLIGRERVRDIFARGRDFYFPNGFRDKAGALRDPYVPVEFAVAAFRYGHSQVRNSYQLREDYRVDLFRRDGGGLPAFHPLSRRHLVDWRYFFEIEEAPPPNFNWSRRIDPLVTVGLHQLNRNNVVGPKDQGSLPARNMQRGRVYFLPSGQGVASEILPVLEQRGVLDGRYRGKAYGRREHGGGWEAFLLQPNDRTRYFLGWEETPLWYYVLQEAEAYGVSRQVYYTPAYARPYRGGPRLEPAAYAPGREGYGAGGKSLGPVGGTIVGEVLIGLLEHFREKTGKGLAYQPELRGSTSVSGYGQGGDRPRYLMRNFLIDAGVVEAR